MAAPLGKMRARVRLEVEVTLDQPWGHDETVAMVHERAAREGLQVLEIALVHALGGGKVKVVGTPRVTGIITED